MSSVFLSIGSNLGNRRVNMSSAVSMISEFNNTDIVLESSNYETAPMYILNQGDFLNKVIKIQTKLNPYELLEKVKSIESGMGRNLDDIQNSPRVIDIDILTFDDLIVNSNDLILPHPRILERLFVLKPWLEIAPHYVLVNSDRSSKSIYESSLDNNIRKQKVKLVKD